MHITLRLGSITVQEHYVIFANGNHYKSRHWWFKTHRGVQWHCSGPQRLMHGGMHNSLSTRARLPAPLVLAHPIELHQFALEHKTGNAEKNRQPQGRGRRHGDGNCFSSPTRGQSRTPDHSAKRRSARRRYFAPTPPFTNGSIVIPPRAANFPKTSRYFGLSSFARSS